MEQKTQFLATYIEVKRMVDILYDTQDHRISTENRIRGLPQEVKGLYVSRLLESEDEATKRIEDHLKRIPESAVFEDIRGMGPRLTGSWIANVMVRYDLVKREDIEECSEVQQQYKVTTKNGDFRVPSIRGIISFETVSKMWAWCGLVPGIRRVRGEGWVDGEGETVKINPAMQVLSWKTRGQFVRQGDVYRKIYDAHKAWLSENSKYAVALENPELCPRYGECVKRLTGAAKRLGRKAKKPPCKGHIDKMARKHMVKDFIRDFYVRWLKMDGLPVPTPYDPDHVHHDEP